MWFWGGEGVLRQFFLVLFSSSSPRSYLVISVNQRDSKFTMLCIKFFSEKLL